MQENELVTLTCIALAQPEPSITWSANGTVRPGAGTGRGSLRCWGLPVLGTASQARPSWGHVDTPRSHCPPLQVQNRTENYSVVSNLTVQVTSKLMRSGINCTATNYLGVVTHHIHLERSEWPNVGLGAPQTCSHCLFKAKAVTFSVGFMSRAGPAKSSHPSSSPSMGISYLAAACSGLGSPQRSRANSPGPHTPTGLDARAGHSAVCSETA